MRRSGVDWHDVECGGYASDLPVWRELAADRGDPLLDLGCGTGRVALALATEGRRVVGLDSDPELVAALRRRGRGLAVEAVTADARSFELGRRFPLAIAPMQVVQLLGGPAGRARMLESVARHLEPGGLLALALADPFEGLRADDALPPLPDVRESADGWVLSSLPVALRPEPGAVAIDRLRQAVSPAGELEEELVTLLLDDLAPDALEAEGEAAGLRSAGRRLVPETRKYIGSTVVLLEAPA